MQHTSHDVQFTKLSEKEHFKEFLKKICNLCRGRKLYDLIWGQFSGAIRSLLSNQFVYQPFWDFYNGEKDINWKENFEKENSRARKLLVSQNEAGLLGIILERLYTLRNQLIHGGATYNSSVNRDQLRDATALMSHLVPLIIEIMIDNPDTIWGDPFYPVVKDY